MTDAPKPFSCATTHVVRFKKGYKFRVYPTPEQLEPLAQAFGSARFVYNTLLVRTIDAHKAHQADPTQPKPALGGYDFTAQLPVLKAEHPWLKEASAVALQQACLHLGQAYANFFRNLRAKRSPGYPKFKSKRHRQSITLTTLGFTLRDNTLRIAKLPTPLNVIWSRELPSQPTSLTLSMTPSGEYYVSFICEYLPPKTQGTQTTGIDLGLTHLATLSNGIKIDNPRHYQRTQARLRRAQQSLSRKAKTSKNCNRQRLRVAKLHTHIAAQRTNHLHKLSRALINDNQVIGIEHLHVAGMVKNRKLAKHIQSAAWSAFTTQLAYKARESQHVSLVMVNRFFPSSHLCAETGHHLGRKLKLSERNWDCPHCGHTHDRDVNAAQVIAKETELHCDYHGLLRQPHQGAVSLAGKRNNEMTPFWIMPTGQSVSAC